MKIEGKDYRTVWMEDGIIKTINQLLLPGKFEIISLKDYTEVVDSIKTMIVRGAPAIGAMGAYGLAQAINQLNEVNIEEIKKIKKILWESRPTAYDLTDGLNFIFDKIKEEDDLDKIKEIAMNAAEEYADKSVEACRKIGEHGEKLIKDGFKILTHCNAGALATVDYGTALAPIRMAHSNGKKIFVFADETRPRLQGAKLTAWELVHEKITHAIIADNAAGYYMKNGKIDIVITGADRVAANGDAANKIGTYEKAVLAKENNIPFYIAVPFSTIDFDCEDGDKIPIEERDEKEVLEIDRIRIGPEISHAKNPAFDVTSAKYITGIITEKGIFRPEDLKDIGWKSVEVYSGTKFETVFEKKIRIEVPSVNELITWCKKFSRLGMVSSSDGGFSGNLSFRTDSGFIITAAGADLRNLGEDDFTEVIGVDIKKRKISVKGLKEPSSESFMHHEVYENRKDVNVVFHVHDDHMLKHSNKMDLPITGEEKLYGTAELANEVVKVVGDGDYIVIKNHGILSLGKTIEEAGKLILEKHEEALKL